MRSDHETIIFLHPPRTAGSTLHRIIERQYPPDAIHTRELLSEQSLREFDLLPPRAKATMRFLKGHMPFGVHELLPGPSTYVTMFREPVERVVSFYHYILRRPEDKLFGYITNERMSLQRFVASGVADTHTDNGLTRLWSGDPFVGHGSCSEVMLMRAQDNLRHHCLVVGLTDRFDESLVLLKRRLKWTSYISYRRENVTHGRPAVESIAPSALAVIRSNNEFDEELYRFATAMFEEQVAQEGPQFKREARWFSIRNPVSNKVDPYAARVTRKVKRSLRDRRARIDP